MPEVTATSAEHLFATGRPAEVPGPHYGATPAGYEPLKSFGSVPDGWLWGVATAAHQIEGGNINNDWWLFEHTPGSGTKEPSGDACDSWNRWREDFQLVKDMGLDSYRFSLEWSRIEPAQGEFSVVALDHYRDMMIAAHEMGLKASVTFHHFTTPQWAADQGGWTNPAIVEWFERYVARTVAHLGEHIDIAATFNEPNIVAMVGYVAGAFPPGIKGDLKGYREATENFVAAHHAAREALKQGPGKFPIGLTLAMSDTVIYPGESYEGGVRPTLAPPDTPDTEFAYLMSTAFLEAARGDDYIGVQTYMTQHIGLAGGELAKPDGWRFTSMDWNFTPEALGETVRTAFAIAGVPVIVTENGLATDDDSDRIEYYSRSLTALRAAMDDGVDVRGFFAWSLLDNFEWAEGYRPKFGFVEVDRESFERTPKPSSRWYAGVVAASRS